MWEGVGMDKERIEKIIREIEDQIVVREKAIREQRDNIEELRVIAEALRAVKIG